MTIWESGRESSILDDIIAGRKTIEGRLDRDKFAKYQPGDRVWLRRDYRDTNGVLQDGEPRQALIEVIAVRKYQTFLEMVSGEGYQRVMPRAGSAEHAATSYDTYYAAADQKKFGVLAIEFRLLRAV